LKSSYSSNVSPNSTASRSLTCSTFKPGKANPAKTMKNSSTGSGALC
jgi:hypothetical protein